MAEANEPEVQEPQVPPITEPEVPPEPETPEPAPDEGKPGGDDPQAVRARREYQARKRAEQELEAERIRVARLEGENQALKQQTVKKDDERVFTIAEVNAAVEAGTITRQQGDAYIENVILDRKLEAKLKAREVEQRQLQPLEQAESDIEEYKRHLPFLRDKNDPKFVAVAEQYRRLVQSGLPDNYVTQRTAVEITYGTLDKIRKQSEIETATRNRGVNLMPSDTGGNGGRPNTPVTDISKAPKHLIDFWEKTGTSAADRASEFKYWLKNNPQGRTAHR